MNKDKFPPDKQRPPVPGNGGRAAKAPYPSGAGTARRRRRRQSRRGLVLLMAGLVSAAFLWWALFARQTYKKGVEPQDVLGVPVYTQFVEKGTEGRPGTRRKIRYIIIHETANTSASATARAHADYLVSGLSGEVSWHYTVDDTEIYHHIPDDELAYHAGDIDNPNGGNQGGIGIEVCVNDGGDYTRAVDNTARLVAYLLEAYGLDVSNIRQHYDCSGKNCPANMREYGLWDAFLQQVQGYVDQLRTASA